MIDQNIYMRKGQESYDKVQGSISEREQSEFNSAITYLNRLNALFFQADEAAMQLDAYTWFHSLLVLFRELSTEMKQAEIDEFNKERQTIAALVNNHVNDIKAGRSRGLNPYLYDKLHNLEMQLRGVMRTSGLQMRIKESAMEALK